MQCAIMVVDKSCHCDKVNFEFRSEDGGVRLLAERKFFLFFFLWCVWWFLFCFSFLLGFGGFFFG